MMLMLVGIRNKGNLCQTWGFPGGSEGKESACNVGDLDSITGLGRSPGEGNGYPLQYSINQSVTISLLMDISITGTE